MSTSATNKLDVMAIATNTTLSPGIHAGAFLTNQGATGAVTITLPASSAALAGFWLQVFVTDDQSVTVATATTDTLIVDGDAAADSIAWSTSSHKLGNGATFVCIGAAGWACMLNPAATTTTIATQTIVTN